MKKLIIGLLALGSISVFAQSIPWERAVDGRLYLSDDNMKNAEAKVVVGNEYTNGYSMDMIGMFKEFSSNESECPASSVGTYRFEVLELVSAQLSVTTKESITYLSGARNLPLIGSKPHIQLAKVKVTMVPQDSCISEGIEALVHVDSLSRI